MVVAYVLAAAGTWLQTYLMAGVAQRAVRDMRTDLFARLQTLPLRFFDQRAHGDLMSRLTNDVENISNMLATNASQLIANVLGLVGVIVVMFMHERAAGARQPGGHAADRSDLTRQIAKRTRAGFPRDAAGARRAERHHRGDHHRRARGQGLRARGGHHRTVCDQPTSACKRWPCARASSPASWAR